MASRRAPIAVLNSGTAPTAQTRSPRRHSMHSSRRFMVLFALYLFFIAAASSPRIATAVPFWTGDQDISDGDVNDTFTSSNGQHFLAVDDSNNLYVAFFDDRFKVPNGDNNFEIFFRRFIYNFGSPF